MAAGAEPVFEEINLMSLTVPQLNKIKNQLDQTLSLFQESIKSLKLAQTKLSNSGESLKKLTKDHKGADILMPLSPYIYVLGTIADLDNVMIDIGTGYFVQKDMDGAIDYCKRKVNFITEQMEKIQEMGLEKSKVRDAVVEVLDVKLQAQLPKANSEPKFK